MRFRFAEFELDGAAARLRRAGAPVELQPKVFDALLLFVERSGELISKDELLRALWPDTIVSEESLTQVVRKLRSALGDDPAAPRFLETVPKRGYRFVGRVERVEEGAPTTAAGDSSRSERANRSTTSSAQAASESRPRRGRPMTGWLLVSVLLLAALVWAFAALRPQPQNPLLEGGEPRRITATVAREGTPAISRDGRFAAVSVNRGVGGALELELVPLDGGRPIALTESAEDEWQPRFSSDGERLLFLRGLPGGDGAALWSMNRFGGNERRIAPLASTADWAPDGQRVALARPDGRGSLLELLEPATGAWRALVTSREPISSLGFSPDGRRLAYLEGNSITATEVESGRRVYRSPPARHVRTVVWESDESLLTDAAWSEGVSRVSRLPLDGAVPEPLLVGPPGIHELALSATGRLIYIAEHKSRQIWQLEADGGGAVALDLPTTVEGFDVDAAAERLAFTDWDPAPGFGTLGLLELGSGARRELGDGLCPALAQGGDFVAALGDRPGLAGLGLIALATGERAVVAPDPRPTGRADGALFRCPDFSPDGRWLAYATVGAEGDEGLWLVEIARREVRRIARGSFGAPSWSPSGKRIAACDYGRTPASVRVVTTESGAGHDTGLVCPFRAGPVWESDDELWLLEDQKLAPALALWSLDGRRGREVALAVPRDLGFWGVFDVRRGGGSWFALAERYESDLYLIGSVAR